jgi:chemotaxis methyl-accepting protein methylase
MTPAHLDRLARSPVAMTVLEHLRPGPGWPVEIVAVDVSETALASARRGRFPADALAAVPPAYRRRSFVRDGDGHRVGPLVREMVRFFRHDIRRDFYLGKFDIVFCCDVLLYFTPVVRGRVIDRLAGALRSGGHLFLGHADGIRPPAPVFRARDHEAGVVYRRA